MVKKISRTEHVLRIVALVIGGIACTLVAKQLQKMAVTEIDGLNKSGRVHRLADELAKRAEDRAEGKRI